MEDAQLQRAREENTRKGETQEVMDGIYRFLECSVNGRQTENFSEGDAPSWYIPGTEVHNFTQAYLVDGERTLLYDTLSPSSRSHILREVDEILDGRDLDYLVVSHCEAPHGGNAIPLMEEYPDLEIIAPSTVHHHDMHELYYLSDATLVDHGDTVDLGDGYGIEFQEAAIMDGPTIWAYEWNTNSLFTSDGFGGLHCDGECDLCTDDLDDLSTMESRLTHFHARPMFWMEWADVDRTYARIERLLDSRELDLVGPAHGFPIRHNVREVLEKMHSVLETADGGSKEFNRLFY